MATIIVVVVIYTSSIIIIIIIILTAHQSVSPGLGRAREEGGDLVDHAQRRHLH
jgi:hypothetical protein